MAFRVKKPSLTGHSASHTPSKHVPRDKETHTCHLTPPACTRCHLDLLLAENRITVCHQRLSPFPQRRPKRQHAHTKPFISRPPCWKKPSFEDQFCHASTSPTRLGMRRTEEPPTCSQCGARGSNTVKNTPRSSEVQKKKVFNTSSMSLAQIKWKHLQFHRCHAFDTSLNHVRIRSTCVKSATSAAHCSCCSACCNGWGVRTSCETEGQMILLVPRVEFLWLLCTNTRLFCFHLPKIPGISHC